MVAPLACTMNVTRGSTQRTVVTVQDRATLRYLPKNESHQFVHGPRGIRTQRVEGYPCNPFGRNKEENSEMGASSSNSC